MGRSKTRESEFRFTEEIRKLMYTINPIKSFHLQLRKITKNGSFFPSDTAVLKLLHLATQKVLRKWTVRIRERNKILAQLSIHFEARIQECL
jgi:transposase-like protein